MSVDQPMGILQRIADVVRSLAEYGPMTRAAIADHVNTPRPSVYRLTDALREAELAESLPDARIALSLRWLRLADAARAAMTEWADARPVLDDLAGVTGQTVFLSVHRGDQAVCIDWARGEAINVLLLKPGRSLPLHAGAAGRVVLAYGLQEPETYLARAPFHAFTEHTLCTARALRADIRTTLHQGYVVSDVDVTDGIGALGAPLFRGSPNGGFAGALSLAGLADEITERRAEMLDKLLAAAQQLTRSLA